MKIETKTVLSRSQYDSGDFSCQELADQEYIAGHYAAAALTGYCVGYIRSLNGTPKFPRPEDYMQNIPVWRTRQLIDWAENKQQ